jgi:peptide/nickel transport system substrate-binding protein
MDQASDKAPGVTEDIPNPFKDKRVREAISLAIDRKVIVDRVMGGLAIPANQFLPEMMFGHNKAIPALDRNPERAKALLAEAGLPNGFELTLSTPNDRYNNDERVAQAIAQMLTRAGIKTKVQSFTSSVFFSKRNVFEFGIWLAGWGAQTGEMSSPLRSLAATVNKDLGNGVSNQGRYSNPEVDALIAQATATVDDAARRALLEQAMAKAMTDVGVIPLHYEVRPWAMRKGLSYTPRADEFTFAFDITRD